VTATCTIGLTHSGREGFLFDGTPRKGVANRDDGFLRLLKRHGHRVVVEIIDDPDGAYDDEKDD
jgi:hypothetical protein